jgi:hypothetical protein
VIPIKDRILDFMGGNAALSSSGLKAWRCAQGTSQIFVVEGMVAWTAKTKKFRCAMKVRQIFPLCLIELILLV